MTGLVARLPSVQAALDNLAAQYRVPGASLAIMDEDETVQVVTGVTSHMTETAVTADTLFQIGSITKVYTTTMLMQLVDTGKVDLDKPISHYLPDLKLKPPSYPDVITVGQLVNHTSGIVGDFFEDHGRGDDCIARYVAALEDQIPTHPPGLMFSYSNAAFTIAGYLIEQVTGRSFHTVFDEQLRQPLGLRQTTVLAEEMLAYRYAVGHSVARAAQRAEPVPTVLMPRSSVPAGSRTSATASDVLKFARFHLDGGITADGTRRLSENAVKVMQERSVSFPTDPRDGVGRGWLLGNWDGERVIAHNGGTYGQLAFLYVLPERRFAVCLLTNADSRGALWALGRWIFKELAGIEMPRPPKPLGPGHDLELEPYAGTYERISNRYVVEPDGRELLVTWTSSEEGEDHEPQRLRLDPIDSGRFLTKLDEIPTLVSFLEFDEHGRPGYIHVGGRAAQRVEGLPPVSQRLIMTGEGPNTEEDR